MSGALHRHFGRRGWAGGGRVRGYAGGGPADDPTEDLLYPASVLLRSGSPQPAQSDADDGSGIPVPPIPPAGGPPPAPQGALPRANPPDQSQAPTGAYARSLPPGGGAGPPDQQDAQAAQKMSDMNKAMAVLQASRAGTGINPMLQFAGAMLAPTRTGGFSESLGAGLTAYGKAGEQERATDEQMAERLLQAQWQNDYRGALLQTRQNVANTQVGGRIATTEMNVAGRQGAVDTKTAAQLEIARGNQNARIAAADLRSNAPPAAVKTYDFVTSSPGVDANGNPLPPLMQPSDALELLKPKGGAAPRDNPAAYAARIQAQQLFLQYNPQARDKSLSIADQAKRDVDNMWANAPGPRTPAPQRATPAPATPAPTPAPATAAPAPAPTAAPRAAAAAPAPAAGAQPQRSAGPSFLPLDAGVAKLQQAYKDGVLNDQIKENFRQAYGVDPDHYLPKP